MTHPGEHADGRYDGLDTWPTGDVLEALWNGQSRAVAACRPALPDLERAVNAAVERLAPGSGRLAYVGAGSSGMIAALDALDLGPTFDWPEERTVVLLAGGGIDLRRGLDPAAEDDAAAGAAGVRDAGLGPTDVVLGISASGSTGYTVAAIEEARRRGAMTIGVLGVSGSPLAIAAEHNVVLLTGDEVIAGSSRLAAGTAQKVMLNLFSTAVMVGLGSVFDNLMIDARPGNAKLRRRRAGIVAAIAGVDGAAAEGALACHGDVKRAVLALAGLSEAEATAALARAGGRLRHALQAIGRSETAIPSVNR